jgi:ArsR family transcriptional regulator, virulence genes transcriptional regulator
MLDMSELEPELENAARLMQMLSQPIRLKLLCKMSEGEQSVLKLADVAGLSQPATSHHLKNLRDSGLVRTRRDGQTIYYSLKGREVEEVLKVLHMLYCPQPDE